MNRLNSNEWNRNEMKVKLKNSRTWHTIANVSFISLVNVSILSHMHCTELFARARAASQKLQFMCTRNKEIYCSSNANFIELFTSSAIRAARRHSVHW